jgi:VanZ family protein
LSIELTQILLPWRVPSAQDLLLNVAGGLMGAWLMVFAFWLQQRRQASLRHGRESRDRDLKSA